ncbi:sugar transporter domain-containing protein [Phthorimaea operculella]|nr:sugar transporter domain-containing protein [Phthorimaea operculella]
MKKYYFFFGEGSKVNQIICAIFINLPISAIASIAYLICIPGDFLMAFLSDWLGRKKALLFMSSMAVIAWVIKLSSLQTWALILARSFIGILMGGAYVTCPLYTKEISSDSVRGILGSFVILFHVSGNLFSYIIGDILSYRAILWVCLSIPAFHLVIFLLMPESPSYLVKHGKTEEAARVLAWLRCKNEKDISVQNELNQILKEKKADADSSNFAAKAIINDKILFRAFRIAIIVTLAREVCGAIPVLNFAGDIFENASKGTSLVLTPNQQAMMLGGVQLAGCVLASSIVEKTGRKPLLAVTSFVSGLSMCVLASWFVARAYMEVPAWIPVVTLCVCIFCDASGLQPCSVLLCGEMFSFKYRGTVFSVSMALASLLAFIQTMFFKQITVAIGEYVSFYFFGAICIAAAIYAVLVVPETKMRNIEEIHEDLMTRKEKELRAAAIGEKVETEAV